MKKSHAIIMILIIIALFLGVWLGLKIFSQKSAVPKSKVADVQAVKESLVHITKEIRPKDEQPKKKKSFRINTQDYRMHELEEVYNDVIETARSNCADTYRMEFANQDFLDDESDFFEKEGRLEETLRYFQKNLDITNFSNEFDHAVDKYTSYSDFDPAFVKAKIEASNICNEPELTNLFHATIRAIARDKEISLQKKRAYTRELLNVSERFLHRHKRIEYTFTAMEIVYSLVDNELVANDYTSEMKLLRDDMIRFVQNFESDFSVEGNDLETDRELIVNYRQSIADVNESITLLIEKMRSDIPN